MSQGIFSTCIQPCWRMLQNQKCNMSVPLKNAIKWEGAGPSILATCNSRSSGFGASPNPRLALLLTLAQRNLAWAGHAPIVISASENSSAAARFCSLQKMSNSLSSAVIRVD